MTLCMCSRSFQSVECVHFALIECSDLLCSLIDKLLVTVATYLRQFLLNKCSRLAVMSCSTTVTIPILMLHCVFVLNANILCAMIAWYLVMFQFFYRSVAMRTSCSSNQQKGSNLIEHLKRLALYVLHSL